MDNTKWTIRGIDEDARAVLAEIHDDTGVPYGRLVNMALWDWIESLDMDDPVPIVRYQQDAA